MQKVAQFTFEIPIKRSKCPTFFARFARKCLGFYILFLNSQKVNEGVLFEEGFFIFKSPVVWQTCAQRYESRTLWNSSDVRFTESKSGHAIDSRHRRTTSPYCIINDREVPSARFWPFFKGIRGYPLVFGPLLPPNPKYLHFKNNEYFEPFPLRNSTFQANHTNHLLKKYYVKRGKRGAKTSGYPLIEGICFA